MDGKGHKLFAPIFSCGTSILICKAGLIPVAESLLVTAMIATACSTVTATLPDADLIALKPKAIIKGTAKRRYSNKYKREYYYINISQREFQERFQNKAKDKNTKSEPGGKGVYIYYDKCGTNNPLMKYMALIFKAMGIKKHRGFQSHSPLLWIPFWMAVTWLSYQVQDVGKFLGAIVLGLGLGWISHLVGDLMTLDGLPLIPRGKGSKDFRIAPLGGKIGKHRIFGFAKASNRIWIGCICFIFINLFMYLLTPDLFFTIWNSIGSLLNKILPVIWDGIKSFFNAILSVLGHK